MTTFQLLLLLIAGIVFYLFFRQLFSGNYPKRGVDFEAKVPDDQIGGISRPDKTFSKPVEQPSRIEELISMVDEAIQKGDLLEARKAVQSALIIDPDNVEALRREGYLYLEDEAFEEAKKVYEKMAMKFKMRFTSSAEMYQAKARYQEAKSALFQIKQQFVYMESNLKLLTNVENISKSVYSRNFNVSVVSMEVR